MGGRFGTSRTGDTRPARERCQSCFPGKTVILPFDDRIALAYPCFQLTAIEYGNVAAAVMDQSRRLQPSSRLRDAFAAHAQHIGNQFLRHRQLVRGQPVQA